MPSAWCLIREGPHYRRNAFLEGLRKTGYTPYTSVPPDGKHDGDLLVVWNRYGDYASHADRFERSGGRVIVAENGYCGRDPEGRQYYALSDAWHQRPLIDGSRITDHGSRFSALGLEVKPWRSTGEHVLICAQRGFGIRPHCMEMRWPGQVANELRKYTRRPIRIRHHPESKNVPPQDRPKHRLEEDFANCWAVVVWSSTAGVKALLAGIPVCRCGPDFIAEGAAHHGIERIEDPWLGDRAPALERAAWGQWSVAELDAGVPFQLMKDAH